MARLVAQAFRDRVAAKLPADSAEMLDNARGGGPDFREVHRALLLADRAARDWGGGAIAAQRPGDPNHLEALGTISRPEDHYHQTEPAARAEAQAAQTQEQRAVADEVLTLANAANDIDTEASLAGNSPALRATAEAAADVLIAAGVLRDDDEYPVEQANQALRDLVSLDGWENQLGPRFE